VWWFFCATITVNLGDQLPPRNSHACIIHPHSEAQDHKKTAEDYFFTEALYLDIRGHPKELTT
jgi:hypothetical protein